MTVLHEQGLCRLNYSLTHFRDGESTGSGAVVGIKRLWRQNPLAPADVSEVHPEVAPGAHPGLAPLSPPGLFHCPLVEAQHLGLAQALVALLTLLPPRFHWRFGFRWEIRVLPQFMILQGVVLDLRDVVGLDLEMKLPPDPWGWGGRILPYREGTVPLERHGHAVRLVYSSIVGVYQDVRQAGGREALLAVRTPLLHPSHPEPHIKLHGDHELFNIPGVFHHRCYIPCLPRAFLERSQSYVSQWCRKGFVWGWSMEEELRGGGIGMLEAAGWVARPSETPQSLVVAGALVEVVKRGGEDEFWFLDGRQVELEHVFAVHDSWGKDVRRRMSRSSRKTKFVEIKNWEKQPAFILSPTLFPSELLALKRTQKKSLACWFKHRCCVKTPEGESVCPPPSIISLRHGWLTQIRPSNISSTKCCSTHLTRMSRKQGKYQAQVPPSHTTKSHHPEIAVLFMLNLVSHTSTTAWKTNTGSVQ